MLMDIQLPGINGIRATWCILEQHPHIGALIVTIFGDETLFAAMHAGAKGYLLKGAEGEEIMRVICSVARGASARTALSSRLEISVASDGRESALVLASRLFSCSTA